MQLLDQYRRCALYIPLSNELPVCLCIRRALRWEGNGQHDPIHGFLSIKLALLPLSFVKWMGLNQLPEKGDFSARAHCRLGSPREERAGCSTRGCFPACLSMGGDQIRDILTFNLGSPWFWPPSSDFPPEAFITPGGNANPLGTWAPPGLASGREGKAW